MITKFEAWVKGQVLTSAATLCFDESVMCYKAGGYRAAYAFSYVGFLNLLRHRIINTKRPLRFASHEWSKIKADLKTEGWEYAVCRGIQKQRKGNSTIFIISEKLLENTNYMAKLYLHCITPDVANIIIEPDVTYLWAFIMANSRKFSAENLFQKIYPIPGEPQNYYEDEHCCKTESELVEQIAVSKDPCELPSFFAVVFDRYDKYARDDNKRKNNFIDSCLEHGSQEIKQVITQMLTSDCKFLIDYLRQCPKWVSILADKPEIVNDIWNKYLFFRRDYDYSLFIALVDHGIIPSSETQDYWIEYLILKGMGEPPDNSLIKLVELGFYDKLKKLIWDKCKIRDEDWTMKSRELIKHYLKSYPLDTETAKLICRTFGWKEETLKEKDKVPLYENIGYEINDF